MFDFSKAQKALFLLIYQQFINKCYLKALKTPKVGDWGLFFVVLIYYKNISYRYIKIIPQSPKIPRKPWKYRVFDGGFSRNRPQKKPPKIPHSFKNPPQGQKKHPARLFQPCRAVSGYYFDQYLTTGEISAVSIMGAWEPLI